MILIMDGVTVSQRGGKGQRGVYQTCVFVYQEMENYVPIQSIRDVAMHLYSRSG